LAWYSALAAVLLPVLAAVRAAWRIWVATPRLALEGLVWDRWHGKHGRRSSATSWQAFWLATTSFDGSGPPMAPL
jgi:hypothetical protein